MIVVNYYQEEDYNPDTDGYHLHLAGVINDTLELQDDVQIIKEAIENCGEFEPKNGVLYGGTPIIILLSHYIGVSCRVRQLTHNVLQLVVSAGLG